MLVRLFVAIATIWLARAALVPGMQTTEDFRQETVLDQDGNFLLFWNFNDTHMTFEAHVKTRG